MEKEFVPYELAVKLKELGLDEPCIAGYRDYNGIKLMTRLPNNTFPVVDSLGYGKYCKQNEHVVKAPLWQQAFDWFTSKGYHYYIEGAYPWFRYYINTDDDRYEGFKHLKLEEARQACLEKLIELIQNKNDRSI